ncbi:hypothetical protein ACFFJ7_10680 [Pseudochelatococcus lubricantis]|uniref:hypothetical protein n=1 Tax=Pseudochelatococcus lubricantis TaxID=1538102 RepID=UPI0035EBD940
MPSTHTPGSIFNADCIQTMRSFDRGSVDFILIDPPYIVNYSGRDGRMVANDDNTRWLAHRRYVAAHGLPESMDDPFSHSIVDIDQEEGPVADLSFSAHALKQSSALAAATPARNSSEAGRHGHYPLAPLPNRRLISHYASERSRESGNRLA